MRSDRTIRLAVRAVLVVEAALGVRASLKALETAKPSLVALVPGSRGTLDLSVYARGELEPVRSVMAIAPPIGGGTLQILHLARTGTEVNAGDVVVEFDPSEQQFNLEQSRSDLAQAGQEITKAKGDAAVQAAQDHSAAGSERHAPLPREEVVLAG